MTWQGVHTNWFGLDIKALQCVFHVLIVFYDFTDIKKTQELWGLGWSLPKYKDFGPARGKDFESPNWKYKYLISSGKYDYKGWNEIRLLNVQPWIWN